MRNLCVIIAVALITLSCANNYYTGNKTEDALIKQVDEKLHYNDSAYKVWSKMMRHGDSIVSYATNRSTNQLITLALAEKKTSRRTFYYLVNGELVKVQYFPKPGNISNFYFFDGGGTLLYKRQRIDDSTGHEKFLGDIISLKRSYGVH